MKTLRKVMEFHKAFRLPINFKPHIRNKRLNKLRVSLLEEEVKELKQALKDKNKLEVLDALTDIQYVLDGAYISLGFIHSKTQAFDIVHESNMAKCKGGIRKAPNGKILKPEGWKPPDLRWLLDYYKVKNKKDGRGE